MNKLEDFRKVCEWKTWVELEQPAIINTNQSHLSLPNGKDGLIWFDAANGCPLRIEKWVSERTMKQSRESEPFSFSNSNKNHFYLSSWKKEWAQRARLVKVGLVLLSLRWVMGLPAMALREKKDKPKQANQPAIHNEWSNSLEWKQRRQWNQFIDGMNFCCAMEKQLRNGAERRKQRMEWFVDGQRNAQPQWIDLNLWESMNEGSYGPEAGHRQLQLSSLFHQHKAKTFAFVEEREGVELNE